MKYAKYIILFAIGVLIGGGMCRTCTDHFRGDINRETDTVYVHDTVRYSRLELTTNRYRLDIPKISSPELVYIPIHSLDTIYRDNIQYVTLPRQFFHTQTPDAEIWHSGIDSTIDSLVVFKKDKVITEKPTIKHHRLSTGINAYYSTRFHLPAYIQYEYYFSSWFAVHGFAEYDILSKQFGVGIGTKLFIEW